MKKIFCFCIFIVTQLPLSRLTAQTLSNEQTERLFKISQLWGHITYFHPYLQYKKIPFDSAFAAAVPKIISAKTNQDLVPVINQWLSVINDPITHAEKTKGTSEEKFYAEFQKRDSIGILTLKGGFADWNDALTKLRLVGDSLKNAKGLVLDLRNMKGDIGWLLTYSGSEGQLFTGSVNTTAVRSIAYSGFVPETGSTSGGYSVYFKTFPPRVLNGRRTHRFPVVFVASASTVLPEIAWALRNHGQAAIIADGELGDYINASSYEVLDGVTVYLRLNEADANTFGPDLSFENIDEEKLLEEAIRLIEKKAFGHSQVAAAPVPALINRQPHYPPGRYPSQGWRVLAAAKIYSVINYFFPNKEMMTVNWDSVTKAFLPRFVAAADSAQYQLAIAALYSNIQDGHGFNTVPVPELLMGGEESTPVIPTMVEGKLVVTSIINDSLAKKAGVEKGDVILKINGEDVFNKIKSFKQYVAASNESFQMNSTGRMICLGADGSEGTFTIQKKDGKLIEAKLPYSKKFRQQYRAKASGRPDDQRIRFLTSEIGYADLNALKAAEVDSMFEVFKNTKAIVFDMRGYPYGTAWTIAPRLTNKTTVGAARFTRLERSDPLIPAGDNNVADYSTWTTFIQYLPKSDKWKYNGKTVMLINHSTMSQAEHTGLFLRAANGTKFIGSQTAGANGDVTNFTIPGGFILYFSGQTVWFPDKRPLQRIGLVPDIRVLPTIRGIQAGRDEVLERAVEFLQKGK